MKAAIYARFSSDLQSPTSIRDQMRICRERCDREGWAYVGSYEDPAMSGTSKFRPGYQRLLADVRQGICDVVVAESLDRLTRDAEHIAQLYKILVFAGVKLFTLSEGWVTEIHVGFGGVMGSLYLKQLAEKTHRGLRGRVEAGKSGGGLTFGYDVVRTPRADGTFEVGDRRVNNTEAIIVRRILESYAAGMPPRKIAWMLNAEGVPGPRGKGWGASTINGNAERGVGIINNQLYVGRLIWNRLKFLKDPETGKRRSRLNEGRDVVEKDVPELRIVSDELWVRVKARQKAVSFTVSGAVKKPWDRRRPRYLLSGLAKCGCCGGGYAMISQSHMGCSNARSKGICKNRQAIGRTAVEATILNALKTQLMAPDLFKVFCEEFIREVNKARQNAGADRAAAEAELVKIGRRLRHIVDAIADGASARTLKDEMATLEQREDELNAKLAATPEQKVLFNPNMADAYRKRVVALHTAISTPGGDLESFEAIRSLIEKVVVTPVDGKLTIDLFGQIAAILRLSAAKRGDDVLGPVSEQLVMVAGARNARYRTFRSPLRS
jgi:DNA invertase Pin-like site-specific DNA recombinase